MSPRYCPNTRYPFIAGEAFRPMIKHTNQIINPYPPSPIHIPKNSIKNGARKGVKSNSLYCGKANIFVTGSNNLE